MLHCLAEDLLVAKLAYVPVSVIISVCFLRLIYSLWMLPTFNYLYKSARIGNV